MTDSPTAPIQQFTREWWGNLPFELGQNTIWEFGTLRLEISRLEKEWQIRHRHRTILPEYEHDQVYSWEGDRELSDNDHYSRYLFTKTAEQLCLLPVLGDRNLVVRPIHTVTLMPDQRITLFVSTALWLKVTTTEQQLLTELAVQELSDTWFGPSPQMGELCYASKTKAVLDKESLSRRPYRAIIPIRIKNQQPEPLVIDRINVPVPHLSLYLDEQGQFWSDPLSLTKGKGKHEVKLQILEKAPDYAKIRFISAARFPMGGNFINKAYDMLFS